MTSSVRKYQNFTEWFDELLFSAEILDNRYPVKGFAVYKSWGWRIIKRIIDMIEGELEAAGHEPVLFPVVIPEDAFSKEAEHIKGFHSEVFWITHAGDRALGRRMLLRPTSETAMYPLFAYWIRSHADLPLRIFQSVPVYRCETKATRPLLRMREFLWNEAHTAHKDWDDAERQVREAVKIYETVFDRLGLSYLILKRPDFDKFAGAVYSLAFDAWNPDGRVNQIGTVHNLGENFAKAFEITYEDVDGSHKNVVQTCYGLGLSRTLAAIIAQHGDDHGLVLPPEIAPIQVVVVPIPYKGFEEDVKEYSRQIYERIRKSGLRVHLDEKEIQPGEKFYYWERFGVPVRVEVGPRDLKEGSVTLSRRDTLERMVVKSDEMVPSILKLFEDISRNLKERSQAALKSMIIDVEDLKNLRIVIKERKIARISWCERVECAERIKEYSEGEVRGHLFNIDEKPDRPCIACGGEAKRVVYVARAY
ncbi:proline--tRNA ligase [Candidatus Bathyarchaeota archaeon]|nr:MAG: proline--tRNA ligase [Candidatus Bathyarchaeota archaeon]